ncbi:MAG: GAF and ANTAR domain-containing protein [Candidatus Nanopelagicales bacterium]
MFEGRMVKIAAMLQEPNKKIPLSERICNVGIDLLGADGIALSIFHNHVLTSEISSKKEFAFLDEQQFTYGEGPTFDASTSLTPISAHNFSSKRDQKTWPIFAPVADKKGVHSMVAFPLRIGNSSIGVLSAYRKNKTEISPDQYVDGITLSTLTSNYLIQEFSGQKEPDLQQILGIAQQDQSLLHLASGMVAEKLNISIIEAMVRIRAYAYKSDLPLTQVANLIVNRKIEMEE